jgi:hypothetical protein
VTKLCGDGDKRRFIDHLDNYQLSNESPVQCRYLAWAGYVATVEKVTKAQSDFIMNLRRKTAILKYREANERITLRWISGRELWGGTGPEMSPVVGFAISSVEPSDS